ncbi:MAG: VCBS repeat-containing protein, partial [Blastocatellia bacterium]|nr:VCBS repeat-containing protein [Blastocatellia bacterium]
MKFFKKEKAAGLQHMQTPGVRRARIKQIFMKEKERAMQLSKLKRFLKASALLMLAALTVATLAPVTRAQEQINFNRRVLNLPGGLGNNLAASGTTGNPASFLFPLGGANAGSNTTSDILTADLNGDGFTDILIGSLSSDEIALFLGRGNGSFVRAQLGALFNGAAINYSDARAFVNEPQNAQFGRVTSMVAVSGFSTATGFSRVAVAIDYTGVPAGSALAANSGDQVLYLDINQNGAALNNTAFFPSGVAATAFTSNPVALSIGSLDTGGGLDVAVLCSGEGSTAGVTGGFVAIDRAFNTSVDQRIGGGTAAGGAVIAENGQSGSLFDTRSYGSGPVPATGNSNTYGAGAAGNRRAFTITPVTGYGAGIAPRAISFGNAAHRDDGANDLFFVGVDFGSVGGAATIATPAPSKSVGEGVVFCLVNNQNANGNILRNARALSEAYDFGNTTPDVQGQQDGVIIRAGNVPSGVAVGDFNGDNRLDVATSNSGSGTVGVALSGTIATIQNSVGVTSGPTINSYPNTQVSFVQVGGAPNTVYVRDLNNDGRLDILGTNIATNGGYAVFGSATTAGTFVGGQIIATNTGAAPLGATRALAVSAPTINGIPGGATVGGGIDFQNGNPGTLADIVFSRTSTASAVAVRYGTAVAAASATFGTVTLSSFVGVVEGRINSDTLPDVAIADRGADRLIVVTNGASGFVSNTGSTVTTFIDLGDLFPNIENGGISSLDGGDVDKNNTFDLVATVDGPNDQVLVLYNIGGFSDIDPRFTIRAFPIGGDPTAV